MAKRGRSSKSSRRPVARRAAKGGATAERRDGWTNDYSGHGTARDRRTFTGYTSDVVADLQAMAAWRSDDILARVIELGPREALRRGIDLHVSAKEKHAEGDAVTGKEQSEAVLAEVERVLLTERVKTGAQWENAYGGAAIFPVLEGAVGDLSEPLTEQYESGIVRVAALHLLEPRELRPASWYTDITHPKFRQPETWRLWPLSGASGTSTTSQVIHESRLGIFPGIRVSNQLQPGQRPGWGDSRVNRCAAIVADYGLAWGSASALLHDFARGVIKMHDLAELLGSANGKQKLQDRITGMEMGASSLRSLLIDGEDDFQRTTTPVSGLEGLLVQMAQRVAAAADMPLTILMGMSPAGMNATGEMDIRAWYDRVEGLRAQFTPIIEWIVRLLMLQTDGPLAGDEPESWSVDFPPLWQPSAKEEAETRKIVADTDQVYFNMGASAEKILEARFGGDTYSPDLHLDMAELKGQAELVANPDDLSPEDLAALGQPPVDPAAGAAAPPAGDTNIQATVLNGAQVGSLVSIITSVVNGEIPRDAAEQVIVLAYQVDLKTAKLLLGDPNFEPEAPAPAVGGMPPAFAANAKAAAEGKPPVEAGDEKPADDEEPDDEDKAEPPEDPAEKPDAEDKAEKPEPDEKP